MAAARAAGFEHDDVALEQDDAVGAPRRLENAADGVEDLAIRRRQGRVFERIFDEQLEAGIVIGRSNEIRARPSGRCTSSTPVRFSRVLLGLTTITEWRPNEASSAGACGRSASIGCASRTMARLKSGSRAASASMTCSGSVSVTGREGAVNFRGPPPAGGEPREARMVSSQTISKRLIDFVV